MEGTMKTYWYRRNGSRVSAAYVRQAHIQAVHAKRYGYPVSPHAPPGMSAQAALADSLERMSTEDWAAYSGFFVSVRRDR